MWLVMEFSIFQAFESEDVWVETMRAQEVF
jgi:hypothetical protein